jgi:hypothetical protein
LYFQTNLYKNNVRGIATPQLRPEQPSNKPRHKRHKRFIVK